MMESDLETLSCVELEACEWLVRVLDEEIDLEDPLPHSTDRRAALCQWLRQSPHHARAFLELLEVFQLLGDAARGVDIVVADAQPKRLKQA